MLAKLSGDTGPDCPGVNDRRVTLISFAYRTLVHGSHRRAALTVARMTGGGKASRRTKLTNYARIPTRRRTVSSSLGSTNGRDRLAGSTLSSGLRGRA
jgi:hypothetical protein